VKKRKFTPNTIKTLRRKYQYFEDRYTGTDNCINRDSEHHVGRWSKEELLEQQYRMGLRDAYQDVVGKLERILGTPQ
jgi:hypothetical protein